MFSKKRGSVDWTIGKLLAIVLLIVVIVIVIWGLTTGGLTPLIERTGGKFDEVLILLSRLGGKQPSNIDCVFQSVNIDGVGNGDTALCKTHCNISLSEEFKIQGIDYRNLKIKGDDFFYIQDNKDIKVDKNLIVDWRKIDEGKDAYKILKNNFEKYMIDEKEKQLSFFQDNIIDFRIGNKYIRWINGLWFEGETSFSLPITDIETGQTYTQTLKRDTILWVAKPEWAKNSDAFRKMEEYSSGKGIFNLAKQVYYRINEKDAEFNYFSDDKGVSYNEAENIDDSKNSYIFLNIFGEDNKGTISQGDDDIIKLGNWFNKQDMIIKFKQKQEETQELKNYLENLEDNSYVFSIDTFKPYNSFVFYLIISGETYGIKVNRNKDLLLVKIKDKEVIYTANPYFITLSEPEWENIKKLNLIYNYLKERC